MPVRRLIFLGSGEADGELRLDGQPLQIGDAIPLERKRSPWREGAGALRVIVGSHPSRADALLTGDGIFPEHVRIYFPGDGSPTDLRALHPASASLNGTPVEQLAWTPLHGGEELSLGPWRFRYEEVGP
jgi:hypothetical protein